MFDSYQEGLSRVFDSPRQPWDDMYAAQISVQRPLREVPGGVLREATPDTQASQVSGAVSMPKVACSRLSTLRALRY